MAQIAALTGLKDRAARNLLALMREHNLVRKPVVRIGVAFSSERRTITEVKVA